MRAIKSIRLGSLASFVAVTVASMPGCRSNRENRRRVRGQFEEISADQTRHARSLHAARAESPIGSGHR
jgi:hypothetical protein